MRNAALSAAGLHRRERASWGAYGPSCAEGHCVLCDDVGRTCVADYATPRPIYAQEPYVLPSSQYRCDRSLGEQIRTEKAARSSGPS